MYRDSWEIFLARQEEGHRKGKGMGKTNMCTFVRREIHLMKGRQEVPEKYQESITEGLYGQVF